MITPHIAARVFNTELMVDARKAEAMLAGLGGRFVDGGVSVVNPAGAVDHVAFEAGRPSMGKLGDKLGRAFDQYGEAPFDMIGSVAVIPIEGTLVHKGAFVGQSSGRTSYQGLQTQIARAARSPAVKGVAFEVDSFGGEVSGAFEAADMIAGLSAIKPTFAILTDNALSAGYLLASQARQIAAPPLTGRAGSIGVITMHVDFSRKLENEGVKVTILTAGAHKAEGNPYQPLPEAEAKRILGRLAAGRERFAQYVGRGRGSRFTAEKAMATEAQHYHAEEALSLGLIDAVASPAEAFDAFVEKINRG